MKSINFDQWRELAQRDPDAFERKRRQTVDALIERMPEPRQQRMRALQWRIEAVCAKSSNPVAAYMELSSMMWDSVYRQRDLLRSIYCKEEHNHRPDEQDDNIIPLYCPLN